MGKMILCSGERTKRPYGFTQTGIRIYSIEELCYYLYHHVYLIEEDLLSDDLFDWIGTELKLPERAKKLKQLKQQKADLKTIVTVILCSSDYFTEYEIKALLKLLDEMIGMPQIKRNCIKAKYYFSNRQYKEAVIEYEIIINSADAVRFTPEEYGDIYHNYAVAKVYVAGLKEASELFYQAYERNHREESLRQYLYSLVLCKKQDEFISKSEEYQIKEELRENILQFIDRKEKEAANSERMKEIAILKDKLDQGKMTEYYQMADEMIEAWKAKIRQL